MLLLCKILFIDLNYGQVTGYKTFSKFPKTSKHCSCPNFRIVREVGYHLFLKLLTALAFVKLSFESPDSTNHPQIWILTLPASRNSIKNFPLPLHEGQRS